MIERNTMNVQKIAMSIRNFLNKQQYPVYLKKLVIVISYNK